MSSLTIRKLFGVCSLEQVFFHIILPKNGVDWWVVRTFIKDLVFIPIVISYIVMCIISNFKNFVVIGRCLSLVLIVLSSFCFFKSFNGYEFIFTYFDPPEEDFYKKYYMDMNPKDVDFKEKRNLVIVFLESFEATYGDPEVFSPGLMPQLSGLRDAHEYIDDVVQIYGTGWTIGGVVGYLCGIPLRVPSQRGNSMGNYRDFLPGAICLTDILKEHGYRLRFLQGSKREFAGHDRFLLSHGLTDEDIVDLEVIAGRHPAAERKGWGVHDIVLYEEARAELRRLDAEGGPFALMLSTIDTHSPGYLQPGCPAAHGDIRDVFLCADGMASDFVNWISDQPFGARTTIVILSDHLSMSNDVSSVLESHANLRRNLNILINPVRPLPAAHRTATHFDMLPTVVEALGGQLPAGRLALGTSLYSEKMTLVESLGPETLNAGLAAYSPYYYQLLAKSLPASAGGVTSETTGW